MKVSKIMTMGFFLIVVLLYFNNSFFPKLINPAVITATLIVFLHYLMVILGRKKIIFDKIVKIVIYIVNFTLLYALLSILWGGDVLESIRYLFFLVIGFGLIPILVSYSSDGSHVLKFFNMFLILTIVGVVIGIGETITGSHLLNSRHYSSNFFYISPYVPTGTFYNENNYASSLSVGYSFLVAYAIFGKIKLYQIICIFTSIVIIWLLIKTESRISLVSLFLSTVFILYSRYKVKKILFILVGSFSMLFLFNYNIISEVLNSAGSILNTDMLENNDSVDFIRLYLVKISVNAMQETFYIGLGPGGFELYCESQSAFDLRNICNAHNWFFEIGANFGIVVMFLQIAFPIILFLRLNKYNQLIKSRKEKMIYLAFFGSLPSIFLVSISLSSILQFMMVWIYYAYLLLLINLTRKELEAKNKMREF